MRIELNGFGRRVENRGRFMLATITIEEAQLNLKDLIDQMMPGEEIIITKDGQPVARLIRIAPPHSQPDLRPPAQDE